MIGWGQLCLLPKQIAGFSDHQNLWKQSINTLNFLHEDSYQSNVGFESKSFSWMRPVLSRSIILQDSLIINILWKSKIANNWYVSYFTWRLPSKEDSIFYYHFLLDVVCCASCPVRFKDFLVINICGWNQVRS